MSTYKGQTPSDLQVDPRIVPFFERFYAVSDDPNAHEEYARSFVPDADFAMGAKKTAGYDGILELRHGLWSGPVKSRKHKLDKIFPFGGKSNEFMLYGTVDYGLKNGKEVTVDWAARAVMTEHQDALKFKLYQVYVVSMRIDIRPPTNGAFADVGKNTGFHACRKCGQGVIKSWSRRTWSIFDPNRSQMRATMV